MCQVSRAVVLLSGGLDSATTLAMAVDQGYDCYCLSFEYGQSHNTEVRYASTLATSLGAKEHRIANIDIGAFGGSALTDDAIEVPDYEAHDNEIPVTYVPARNTIFLSYALGWAEVLGASNIFIGVNAVDYSGYPDCRPEFIEAFQNLANVATRAGLEEKPITIQTPLINLSKDEIIKVGTELGVDFASTVSCYRLDTNGRACARCDSCVIRKEGFAKAELPDPTVYVTQALS